MPNERTRRLFEARMRDVRQFQKREASGAQVSRKFKETFQALGSLSGALALSRPDLARQIDNIEGMVRGVQKEVQEHIESRLGLIEAKVDIDKIEAEIMANDEATYRDYGEYEFSGTIKDRVYEIIYNHAYEAASPYSPHSPDAMKRSLAPLFALAKKRHFAPAAEKAWKDGLKDGGA